MGNRNMFLLSNWQIALELLVALSPINRFYARRKESNFRGQNPMHTFWILRKSHFPSIIHSTLPTMTGTAHADVNCYFLSFPFLVLNLLREGNLPISAWLIRLLFPDEQPSQFLLDSSTLHIQNLLFCSFV